MINLIFCLIPFLSFAYENAGKTEMNGIKFSDYKEFPEKWTLVTIRFRKDTGEMRLVYANELALETLKKGEINYPDGSVLAKTGFYTGSDPQFESSILPRGLRRYQLMVKDKKKYSSTNGWGYALFDHDGKTFPGNHKMTQDACYACHTIVENRGDVFSTPFSFTQKANFYSEKLNKLTRLSFEKILVNKLPQSIRNLIPKKYSFVMSVKNEKLQLNLFQGTLDEMKPILEKESLKEKSATIFNSEDYKKFVIVIPHAKKDCMSGPGYTTHSTNYDGIVIKEEYCLND